MVGEILSKTGGLSYWDNPFQVTQYFSSPFFFLYNVDSWNGSLLISHSYLGLLGRNQIMSRLFEDLLPSETIGIAVLMSATIPGYIQGRLNFSTKILENLNLILGILLNKRSGHSTEAVLQGQ